MEHDLVFCLRLSLLVQVVCWKKAKGFCTPTIIGHYIQHHNINGKFLVVSYRDVIRTIFAYTCNRLN